LTVASRIFGGAYDHA